MFCERWRELGVGCRTDRCRLNTSLLTAEEGTARRGSCPRLRVLKAIGCVAGVIVAWIVQRANEICGGTKILPEPVSCSAVASSKMILS